MQNLNRRRLQPLISSAWLGLPALIAVLLYLPTLRAGFVWDDGIWLVDLPQYRDPALAWGTLVQPFALSPNYYRPVALLTVLAELRLVGLNPAVFHLTNTLLHALNTLLVTLLAGRLVRQWPGETSTPRWRSGSLLAGLLYGIHPVLVEGAAFVSGRFDLLMTTFLLVALWVDTGARAGPGASLARRLWRPLVIAGLVMAAALAKEMGLAVLVVWPLWRLASAGDWKSQQPLPSLPAQAAWGRRLAALAVGILPVVVGLMGAVAVRYAVLGYIFLSNTGRQIDVGGIVSHGLLVARALVTYVSLALWPFTSLAPIHYSALPAPVGDVTAWLALAAALLLITALVVWGRRGPGLSLIHI